MIAVLNIARILVKFVVLASKSVVLERKMIKLTQNI
jgi:hypothetical protein